MAIDYSLLQGQKPGGVVATLPPDNSLNSFAKGIMEGATQGANINALNQQTQQAKELHPLQKQEAEQKLASSKIDLQNKQQAQQDSQTLRAEAQKGEANFVSALEKIDPVAKYQFYKTKADYENVLADISFKNSETKKNNAAVQQSTAMSLAGMANAAQTAESQKPGSGQQVYTILFNQLDKDTQKSLSESGLHQFNPNTYAALHFAGVNALAAAKETEEKKNSTSKMKESKRIADLTVKSQSKEGITEQEKIELNTLQNTGETVSNLDENLNKVDATIAKESSDIRDTMAPFKDAVAQAKEQLKKTPAWALGPIVSVTKLAVTNEERQVLSSTLNQLALQAKNMLGLKGGTQGFTDAERQFVMEIAGNVSQSKQPLGEVLDRMEDLSNRAMLRAWNRENTIRKSSSNYDKWLEANPKPSLTKAVPSDKSSQVQPVQTTNNTKVINGVTYINQNGKWYQQ